jgi:hypothetical protein
MDILCSKSLWKHDMQWSQMPLPPQCLLPVQQEWMGHTFFWNSQEKWSDLICLRLLPTKQMDHLPSIPNAIHYCTYQEEHQIWMDNKASTSLRLTLKLTCSWSCHHLANQTSPFPLKSTLTPQSTKSDLSLPKRTSHLHSIQGNLPILKQDTPSQNSSCLQ